MFEFDAAIPARNSMFRLYLEVRPGRLLPVLELLQLAGQSPRLLLFNKATEEAVGSLMLDFEHVNEAARKALVDWLAELPGVRSVSTSILR